MKISISEENKIISWELESDEDDIEKTSQVKCKSCRDCVMCCYKLLIRYNLYSNAYQMLTISYKYLLCLPVVKVACERSFSTLKYIKIRLRSKLGNENTEAIMLMSVDKETLLNIDNDTIVDSLSKQSKLLSSSL